MLNELRIQPAEVLEKRRGNPAVSCFAASTAERAMCVALGRLGWKGGPARAKKLTAEQRRECTENGSGAMVAALILVTLVPEVSLALPRAFGFVSP